MLNIHDLKAAYEKAIGHETSKSTIYNLLPGVSNCTARWMVHCFVNVDKAYSWHGCRFCRAGPWHHRSAAICDPRHNGNRERNDLGVDGAKKASVRQRPPPPALAPCPPNMAVASSGR